MMRGLPLSGKTEWATKWANEHADRLRLSWTDTLRQMGDKFNKRRRPLAFEATIHTMTEALRQGISVVIDEENLYEPLYRLFLEHANRLDTFIEWHTMETTPHECKQRNAAAGHPIADMEIDRKAERFINHFK